MTDYYNPQSYPKTSCPCEDCPNSKTFDNFNRKSNDPSSLGINECKYNSDFVCSNTMNFNYNQQPNLFTPDPRYTVLNEDFGLTYAQDFYECKNTPCENKGYTSADPRLIDTARAQKLTLDRPPYEGSVKSWKIYDKDLENYGKNYKNYTDIHAGQIQYYVDKELDEPLYKPNFIIRSNVESQIFKDPMGGTMFQYTRQPLTVNKNEISDYQFDRDQMSYREDILSSYGNQINKNDWSMTWKNVDVKK